MLWRTEQEEEEKDEECARHKSSPENQRTKFSGTFLQENAKCYLSLDHYLEYLNHLYLKK